MIKRPAALTLSLSLFITGAALAQNASVGVVLDVGGRKDRSFNQAAMAGVERVKKELGVNIDVFDSVVDADRERGVQLFAKQKKDLVVTLGFLFTDLVTRVAKQAPDTDFAIIDSLPSGPNTVGLTFREQEGSFLVGYAAGMQSSTGVVGFVGGMESDQIRKFDAGFTAGVKFACPNCTVISRYLGKTPAAFSDIAGATRLAGGMKARGADIIYAAAGASGRGVISFVNRAQCIRAADLPAGVKFRQDIAAGVPKSAVYQKACAGNTRPMFFIGVDSNQNYLGDTDNNPATLNHGLTSMVKQIDTALFDVVRRQVKGEQWRANETTYGLENGGVTYALDEYNNRLIPKALQDKIAMIEQMIVTKVIKVPVK